jgi:ABC-type enterochelin transport system ATPase subunit
MITTNNPFEVIDQRLSNIESLLIDIKHKSVNVSNEKKELSERILIKECSEITNLAEATIRTLAHFKKIPYHKEGKFLVFKRSEIISWLDNGRPSNAQQIADDYIKSKK